MARGVESEPWGWACPPPISVPFAPAAGQQWPGLPAQPPQLQSPVWPSSVQAAIYNCSKYHSCSASSHRLTLPPPDTPSPLLFPLSLPASSRVSARCLYVPALACSACLASESFYDPVEAWPPCQRGGKKTRHTHAHTHTHTHQTRKLPDSGNQRQLNSLFLSVSFRLSLSPTSPCKAEISNFSPQRLLLLPPPPTPSDFVLALEHSGVTLNRATGRGAEG